MRSGDFKETYADLVILSDSKLVWGWAAALLVVLVAAPFYVNAYVLSLLTLVFITATGALGPGIGTTAKPAAMQALTSSKPGADIAGVPEFATSATSPLASAVSTSSTRASLLCSWYERHGAAIS